MREKGGSLVFVYGTLRRGARGGMNALIDRLAGFKGMASMQGRLLDLGEYPGAVPTDDLGQRIRGEVYELRDAERALRLLDEYEGAGPDGAERALFRREPVVVELDGGGEATAWVYFFNGDTRGAGLIRSGDYLKGRREGNG